ncbi:NAD-dependent epimerase/dehydratase family protein [Paenibacillus hodogayensis]|uniref:NAD-dependent epimerase/dehydratase family protein n=1 Tax=Paenibacillus hodogayensis TaxID=279208 RepID=A0ABV5VPL5_9BACL
MKILITGSTGRVGRAIYIRLCKKHPVAGLDRAPSSTADFVGDIGDETLLARALKGVDAVVHTAALHAPHVGILPDAEFERINIHATRRLLELAVDAGVSRFVLTSTTALYGDAATPANQAGWVDEEMVPIPRTIYHRTKLAAEEEVKQAAACGRLSATVIRMSRCFPEQASLMSVYRLHRGIDARDVASAHDLALHLNEPGFRIFVASGVTPFEPSDCQQLAVDAVSVLRRRAPSLVTEFEHRGWALPTKIDRVYSPRALCALGWAPRYSYAEVLRLLEQESAEVLPEEHYSI